MSSNLYSDLNDADNAYLAILLVLYPEVSRVCILAGLCGTMANALAHGRAPAQWRMLLRFYPRTSATLLLASHRLHRFWGQSCPARMLARFQAAIEALSSAIVAYAGQAENSDAASNQELARTCVTATTAGMNLLEAIEHDFRAHPLTRGVTPDLQLRALMQDAIAGRWSALSRDGTIAMPGWAERRRHARVDVNYPAEIYGKSRLSVTIRNISVTGVGVEGVTGLKPGDNLLLRIGQLGPLPAVVVWTQDGSAAMEFAQPLTKNNHLLKFCHERKDS